MIPAEAVEAACGSCRGGVSSHAGDCLLAPVVELVPQDVLVALLDL